MMNSKRHLPDIEQWSQSSGSNVIPRRARPGLAGIRPHRDTVACEFRRPAGERGGNHLKYRKDVRTENGSSQGHNLALTGLFVPSSLDSGLQRGTTRLERPSYRGTSLIRNSAPLRPYSWNMPRPLWWSWGGGGVLMGVVPL